MDWANLLNSFVKAPWMHKRREISIYLFVRSRRIDAMACNVCYGSGTDTEHDLVTVSAAARARG